MYLYGSDNEIVSVYNLIVLFSFDMVTILSVKYSYLETYLILTIPYHFGIKGNIISLYILSLNAIILQFYITLALENFK
jgi:hypothetical protein